MKKALVLVAACAVCLAFVVQSGAAKPQNVTCADEVFTGTAFNLTVPEQTFCELVGATVTHDLIIEPDAEVFGHDGASVGRDVTLEHDAFLEASRTTIGRDLTLQTAAQVHLGNVTIGRDLAASEPDSIQTGFAGDEPGPVRIGHNLVIEGWPEGNDFVFDGIRNVTVDHDFRVTGRSVTLGLTISGDTIGHDLVVSDNSALEGFFGPSSLVVRDNTVGHDLIFTGNTAATGGNLVVSSNVVGHNAICAGNDPEPSDGNVVGGKNTCG